MAIKWTQGFTQKDVADFIRAKIAIVEGLLKDKLIDMGEQFVANARSVNTYTDRTRNLRGSIGYTVVKDGVDVFGSYAGAADGQAQARRLVKLVGQNHPRGFALIVVAGMNYAVFVEAKGFDVLTGSSQLADSGITREINTLKEKLSKVKR